MESENLIFNFIKTAIQSSDKSQKILYGNREYIISDTRFNEIRKYLHKISYKDQEKIYSIIKDFNVNQKALFFENIRNLMKLNKEPNLLIQDVRDIKKGLFPRRIIQDKDYTSGCPSTYLGFMRALKSGTLYTAKIKINGKLKRVFIKTPIGKEEIYNHLSGFNKLLIDPETMNVYYFAMDKKGKIDEKSLLEVYSKKVINNDLNDPFTKSFYDFKKELLNRIDAIYGIERIVDTFLRMGGKINPEKYSNPEFREDMIEYLDEKIGTKNLLKYASKIENPKKAAEAKLEILRILSKKFGPDYKKAYSTENRIAAKEYINSFSKRKIIIKPRRPL